jgi:cytochrome c553
MRVPFVVLCLRFARSEDGFGIVSLYLQVRQRDGDRMQESIDATFLNECRASFRVFLRQMRACFVRPSSATAGAIVGVFLAGACFEGASAQPRINAVDGPELRTLYATSQDIAEGKSIVESSCAGCHGANGISESAGVPHLAGQRAAYLYLELKAYQAGVRGESAMNNVVRPLNDEALFKTAAYFASLDPPQTSAANGANAAAADPVQAGKTAAAGCAGCHGDGGISKTPGMPSLVGLDPKYLVAAMKAYKGGQRKNDMMKPMLASVTDAAMNNIALYYGLQKPARAQTPVAGNKAAGETAAAGCAGCHGSDGVSGTPTTPSLAGQDATYLTSALQAYKLGARSDETMKGLAASLDDNAVKNVAAFYAGLEPKQPNVRKPLTAEEWAQRCDRCHGVNGNSVDPRLPALAAQRLDYLEKVLQAYRTGARKSPQMAAMSDVLTEQDIGNVAAYYASQKARGVVFLVLPSKPGNK